MLAAHLQLLQLGDPGTSRQGHGQDGWERLQLALLPKLAKQHPYTSASLEALSNSSWASITFLADSYIA